MGRIKRPTKRVTNTGQQGFGFTVTPRSGPSEPKPLADSRFKDDDPYSIFMGEQRLDAYLREAEMRWVLELRKVLAQLDYSMLTARYSERGRQAFHPRTVLGLIFYGLFVRQKALRDLERLSKLDVGAMWICGGHRIDHSTIGKFVQQHAELLSTEFFIAVTGWVVRELKVRPGLSSIDGTVIESAGSHWRAIRAEAAREQAEKARHAADAAPHDQDLQGAATAASDVAAVAQERCARRHAQGKDSQTVAVVPSDLEAVIQPRKDGAQRPGYKPSTLMHEAGVILGQHVHPSSETAAVVPLLQQHTAIFGGAPPTLLMDAGYHNGPLLGELVRRDIDVLCPSGQAMGEADWEKQGSNGRFGKSQFHFDEDRDAYQCPAGEVLTYADQGKDAQGRAYRRYRTTGCEQCVLRDQCTQSRDGRSVKRYAGDEYKDAMVRVLHQPRARRVYGRRMVIGEPVHAELRERLGLRRFHRCGLTGVRGEFALYCIAFNLKKALSRRAVVFVFVVYRLPDAPRHHVALVWAIADMGVFHGD
jgi:transposase